MLVILGGLRKAPACPVYQPLLLPTTALILYHRSSGPPDAMLESIPSFDRVFVPRRNRPRRLLTRGFVCALRYDANGRGSIW